MKKHIIIYLPNGAQTQYATVDMSSSGIYLASSIIVLPETQSVVITRIEDDKPIREIFTGMPYHLEEF